ncbi:MAG TPA: hypothetical protein VGO50_17350 [Pyrinomonadaceae bacterium]|nr:hypothetical protein [Pyrinomonadaceae bacterium]
MRNPLLISLTFLIFLCVIPAYPQEIGVHTAGPLVALGRLYADLEVEPSGVEPIGTDGKYLLIADDKNENLLVVNAANAQVAGCVEISEDLKSAKSESPLGYKDKNACARIPQHMPSLKWEGLALDSDGTYYAIDAFPKSSGIYLFSFSFDKAKLNQANPAFVIAKPARKIPRWITFPANFTEPVNVEGLAIVEGPVFSDNSQRVLIVGLRNRKTDEVQVFGVDANDAKGKARRLFRFNAKTLGGIPLHLSSIEYVDRLKGFVILTSTEQDPDSKFYGNVMWFLPFDMLKPLQNGDKFTDAAPQKVWTFAMNMKAEGICILPAMDNSPASPLSAVIVYDNDRENAPLKQPSYIQTITLGKNY